LRDIEVDLLAAIAIMKVMVPQLRTRAKRSAIINMASIGTVYLFPRLGVYSSVKKSLDNVSRILSLENSDKVDIISVRPFGVSTRMSLMMKGAFVLTPRQCALGVLRDLLGG
jgi:short-subunit dehydrogenase